MKPLPFTEVDLLQNTTDKVFARGEDYWKRGMVSEVVRRGSLITAEVEGSEDEPYFVSVSFGKSGAREVDCTCPYMEEWSGWCKHVVATLLVFLRAPDEVETRLALKAQLADLDRDQLQKLVLTMAQEHPYLLPHMESEIERLLAKRAASQSTGG